MTKETILSEYVSCIIYLILRIGATRSSPTTSRVCTGVMVASDTTQSSGSTLLQPMARNTSVPSSQKMIKSLCLAVTRGRSGFDQVVTAHIHRRSAPPTRADSQLRSIWGKKAWLIWRWQRKQSLQPLMVSILSGLALWTGVWMVGSRWRGWHRLRCSNWQIKPVIYDEWSSNALTNYVRLAI